MISPKDVQRAAKRLERENMRFRTFLKGHADRTISTKNSMNSTGSCLKAMTVPSAGTAAEYTAQHSRTLKSVQSQRI